jgi:hypothetical protein
LEFKQLCFYFSNPEVLFRVGCTKKKKIKNNKGNNEGEGYEGGYFYMDKFEGELKITSSKRRRRLWMCK